MRFPRSIFPRRNEDGSAIVGYVLVGIITIAVVIMVAQFIFLAYTRILVLDAAGEGARYAARFDANTSATNARVRASLARSAPGVHIEQIAVSHQGPSASSAGRPVISCQVEAKLPVAGPWLRVLPVHARGHAVQEVIDKDE